MTKQLNVPTDIDTLGDKEIVAVWSMDDNLLRSNQPAINGVATIVYDQRMYEDGELHSVLAIDPTYSKLFEIANDLIIQSGDHHHVFIEGFEYNEQHNHWELLTGS